MKSLRTTVFEAEKSNAPSFFNIDFSSFSVVFFSFFAFLVHDGRKGVS